MQKHRYIAALVIASWACSTPVDRGGVDPAYENGHDTTTDAPPSAIHSESVRPETHDLGDTIVHMYTYQGIADHLGVGKAYVYLASSACTRQGKCIPDVRIPGTMHDCRVNLSRTWCPPGTCPPDGLDPDGPEWTECYQTIAERSCERLAEPVDCQLMRERSLVFSPTAWK